MRLLLDSNIILEGLLLQDKQEEVGILLKNPAGHDLFLSDYALHSIGTILFSKKQRAIFDEFLTDLIGNAGLQILSLQTEKLHLVSDTSQKFGLDFDDAYQYTVAEKNDLTLVSFDKDFDKTERGRKTPAEILTQKS